MYASNVVRPHRVPRLLPLSPGVLPRWSQGEGRVFRVLAEGAAADRELLRGDLLFVRGDTRRDQLGVLVSRGYGRPMLGIRTEKGLRCEPGGVNCSLERWQMSGRLVARARSFRSRPRSGQVLRQIEDVAEYPAGLEAGPWVALELGGAITSDIDHWLSERVTAIEPVSSTRLVAQGPWFYEGCPLLRGGALIAELRDHFGLRASVGVAREVDAAVAALQLAMPSAVIAVEAGCEAAFVEPLLVAPAAQLSLLGGA